MSLTTTGQLVHWKNQDAVRPVALGDRFLFFVSGFHDWAYQSPVAAQWRRAMYTSPQALALARSVGVPNLESVTHLPIYLMGVDSIDKIWKGNGTLGRNKLVQFILLARLALTDPERHKIFSQYLDKESVDAVLQEIASWPMDRQYLLVTESY